MDDLQCSYVTAVLHSQRIRFLMACCATENTINSCSFIQALLYIQLYSPNIMVAHKQKYYYINHFLFVKQTAL